MMMGSIHSLPVLIRPDGSEVVPTLHRLLQTSPASGAPATAPDYDEAWLEALIFRHPNCLALERIDPHLHPLVPVCRQLETGGGPADALFVTTRGQLVLVEAKLWRNHEARRQVVAQILDYAQRVSGWKYENLEVSAAKAAGEAAAGGFLVRCVQNWIATNAPDCAFDEAAFIDGVGRCLARSEWLLLIVGDGIRDGALDLVNFLEQHARMRYRLATVEIATYGFPDGSLLIVPRVPARTVVTERTLLVSSEGDPLSPQEAADGAGREGVDEDRVWFTAFWSDFNRSFAPEDPSDRPPAPGKSTNINFRIPGGFSVGWISAYIAGRRHRVGVYLTLVPYFARTPEIYESLRAEREGIESEYGSGLDWKFNDGRVYVGAPSEDFANLDDSRDRSEAIAHLAESVKRLISVFRPRLAALIAGE